MSDDGFPVRQSVAEVKIAVKRWTEEVVKFTKTVYTREVREDKSIGSHLLQVNILFTFCLSFGFVPFFFLLY